MQVNSVRNVQYVVLVIVVVSVWDPGGVKACFSPLVFAATRAMGLVTTTMYRKLASMLAEK